MSLRSIRSPIKMKKIRTNIMIPVDLAEEIRKVVGPRARSSFLVEAAWEKLERMKLANALKESAGAWSSELHPDLQTQEDINKWLRSLRQEDSERLKGSTIEDISAGQ